MAKQVIWSLKAQDDRKQILTYWIERNQSNVYSRKLNQLFQDVINLIAKYPQIGKSTDMPNAKIKIIRNYIIVYESTDTHIYILAIWDSRQDPDKFPVR